MYKHYQNDKEFERDKYIQKIKDFSERIKMAFYYEFDELIPSIMADKIDEICKEFTEKYNET